MLRWILLVTLLTMWSSTLLLVESCNEAVCASVVSKCMLTKSCNCELTNCSCCKECFACLHNLYNECCSCVGMCPKPNETNSQSSLSKQSHVEDLPDHPPALFNALMGGAEDSLQRWVAFTFPVDQDASMYWSKHENEMKIHTMEAEQDVTPIKDTITRNCTVAYMRHCMSWKKCKKSCESTGASQYRWFHNACCECIGEFCINYGINESRCQECPEQKEDSAAEEDSSLYTYEYSRPKDKPIGVEDNLADDEETSKDL